MCLHECSLYFSARPAQHCRRVLLPVSGEDQERESVTSVRAVLLPPGCACRWRSAASLSLWAKLSEWVHASLVPSCSLVSQHGERWGTSERLETRLDAVYMQHAFYSVVVHSSSYYSVKVVCIIDSQFWFCGNSNNSAHHVITNFTMKQFFMPFQKTHHKSSSCYLQKLKSPFGRWLCLSSQLADPERNRHQFLSTDELDNISNLLSSASEGCLNPVRYVDNLLSSVSDVGLNPVSQVCG